MQNAYKIRARRFEFSLLKKNINPRDHYKIKDWLRYLVMMANLSWILKMSEPYYFMGAVSRNSIAESTNTMQPNNTGV